MAPDSTLNTVFILAQYIYQENANFTIDLFDMTHFTSLGRFPFSTMSNGPQLNRFIRWGNNGLAVDDTSGILYLISGSFVGGNLKRAPGPQVKMKPAHKPSIRLGSDSP